MNDEPSFKDLMRDILSEQKATNMLLTQILQTVGTLTIKIDEFIDKENPPIYVLSQPTTSKFYGSGTW